MLAQMGGVNVGETTPRAMKKLMTTAVAKRVNWKGVGGKFGFSKSNLRKILFGEIFYIYLNFVLLLLSLLRKLGLLGLLSSQNLLGSFYWAWYIFNTCLLCQEIALMCVLLCKFNFISIHSCNFTFNFD